MQFIIPLAPGQGLAAGGVVPAAKDARAPFKSWWDAQEEQVGNVLGALAFCRWRFGLLLGLPAKAWWGRQEEKVGARPGACSALVDEHACTLKCCIIIYRYIYHNHLCVPRPSPMQELVSLVEDKEARLQKFGSRALDWNRIEAHFGGRRCGRCAQRAHIMAPHRVQSASG